MDDVQENRFNAVVKVDDFLEDNAVALSVLPQIATAKSTLEDLIDALVTADGIATTDTTGYAELNPLQLRCFTVLSECEIMSR